MSGNSATKKATLSLIRTNDRGTGIRRALELLDGAPVQGKDVLLKPNFNTADAYPGSTHNDTLRHLILQLRRMGAGRITLGERSGPPDTADVLADKDIYRICRELDAAIINFEDLPPADWALMTPEKSSWRKGFHIARPVLDARCIVTTCCLKTHAYGGVFTMSLKLSVGMTHKKDMGELHGSPRNMRKMIAEINQAYSPALVLLDGIEAFTDGGPAHGTRKRANVMIAGSDRIAIDAAGLAVLKDLGSDRSIMGRKIFEQEQISRAVELGLGVARSEGIEFITDDDEGRRYADRLRKILMQG